MESVRTALSFWCVNGILKKLDTCRTFIELKTNFKFNECSNASSFSNATLADQVSKEKSWHSMNFNSLFLKQFLFCQ